MNDANGTFLILFLILRFFNSFGCAEKCYQYRKTNKKLDLNCLKDLYVTPADSGGRTGFCGWNASLACEHIHNKDTSWQIRSLTKDRILERFQTERASACWENPGV